RHLRAARLHHRHRAGRPGARGRARQPGDHRARPGGRDATGDPLTMAQTPATPAQADEAQLDPRLVLDEMKKNGVTHVVWLPDSETNFLYQLMEADPSLTLVPVSREGLAFSIAAGLATGGQHPIILIQNTDRAATYTERFLNAFGITYYLVESSADAPRISIAFEEARRTQRPVAVLMADEYHGFNR